MGAFRASLLYSLHTCRTTSHTNTAQFHGCFLGNTEVAFLYEHCSRGSLEDIFSNPELELDWVFRLSFALDAAEGMMYLHNKRIIHGRVSTATCIVNEQWTLKLKGIDKGWNTDACMHNNNNNVAVLGRKRTLAQGDRSYRASNSYN